MEQTEFIFRCRPLTGDALLPQVSRALEKRAALLSREEVPAVLRLMDRLNDISRNRFRTTRRGRWCSGVLLGAGLLLLAVGLAEQSTLVPVLAGIAAVMGLAGCLHYRAKPKTALELAAEKLLATRALIGDDQVRVLFRPDDMIIELDHRGEHLRYPQIQLAVETEDTWLLAFGERAMVLLKQDLTGDPAAFAAFLAQRVRCVQC